MTSHYGRSLLSCIDLSNLFTVRVCLALWSQLGTVHSIMKLGKLLNEAFTPHCSASVAADQMKWQPRAPPVADGWKVELLT